MATPRAHLRRHHGDRNPGRLHRDDGRENPDLPIARIAVSSAKSYNMSPPTPAEIPESIARIKGDIEEYSARLESKLSERGTILLMLAQVEADIDHYEQAVEGLRRSLDRSPQQHESVAKERY